jgi:hypothetical protein
LTVDGFAFIVPLPPLHELLTLIVTFTVPEPVLPEFTWICPEWVVPVLYPDGSIATVTLGENDVLPLTEGGVIWLFRRIQVWVALAT